MSITNPAILILVMLATLAASRSTTIEPKKIPSYTLSIKRIYTVRVGPELEVRLRAQLDKITKKRDKAKPHTLRHLELCTKAEILKQLVTTKVINKAIIHDIFKQYTYEEPITLDEIKQQEEKTTQKVAILLEQVSSRILSFDTLEYMHLVFPSMWLEYLRALTVSKREANHPKAGVLSDENQKQAKEIKKLLLRLDLSIIMLREVGIMYLPEKTPTPEKEHQETSM